jgi:hypothetical protein
MKKYLVQVDRGVEFDPLTGRVMDLRGQSGPPFTHVAHGKTVDADPASAEPLVKKGFLVPVAEKRAEERVTTEIPEETSPKG